MPAPPALTVPPAHQQLRQRRHYRPPTDTMELLDPALPHPDYSKNREEVEKTEAAGRCREVAHGLSAPASNTAPASAASVCDRSSIRLVGAWWLSAKLLRMVTPPGPRTTHPGTHGLQRYATAPPSSRTYHLRVWPGQESFQEESLEWHLARDAMHAFGRDHGSGWTALASVGCCCTALACSGLVFACVAPARAGWSAPPAGSAHSSAACRCHGCVKDSGRTVEGQ